MTLKEHLENQLKNIVPDPETYVGINNNPKIVMVNGYWSKYFKLTVGEKVIFSVGPDEGGERYWGTFFFQYAQNHFNSPNAQKKYADGSSQYGGDQSGQDRVNKGENWAQRNYSYLTSNSSNTLDFYLVGHSEGGAFSVGIANYLHSRGHKIKETELLSNPWGFR